MKTAADPRHKRRQKALQSLFQYTYTTDVAENELARLVVSDLEKIDKIIAHSAPEWPIDKLNKIDLSILRLAIYELIEGNTPSKVVIDEAVELAKQYGADNSPRFINGALGTAYKQLFPDSPSTS